MKDPDSITTSLINKQIKQEVGCRIFVYRISLAKHQKNCRTQQRMHQL